jgi:hypothetical protein
MKFTRDSSGVFHFCPVVEFADIGLKKLILVYNHYIWRCGLRPWH